MDLKLLAFLMADLAMVTAGATYGWKFLKKGNYLLGIEWLVVALSGTNFFVYSLTGSQSLYSISYFFDSFSRAFGFTLIGVAGLMAVTHKYKPSIFADCIYFVVTAVITTVLVAADFVEPFKPVFYLVMWTGFSLYLTYFAWRLLAVGERAHALGVVVVMVSCQAIATIYDFYHIPGDDDQHTLFYIAALSSWGFALFELYHAYCALERKEEV